MLILPTATYRAGAFLRAAERQGIECVVASEEAPTLARLMEGRVLTLDLGNPGEAADAAAAFAEHRPVDAVVGVDEASVLTAAHVAARIGVGRNPVAAVAATRDKRRMRTLLAGAAVAQPAWVEIVADSSGTAAAGAVAAVGLPCVVKPVDLAGSRGVIRADTVEELARAIARDHALLRRPGLCAPGTAPPLVVEAFVGGPEIAIEGLLDDGELMVLAVFDKPDPLDGPYFTETLYVTPSRHDPAVVGAAIAVTRSAVAALGLRDGPVHAELRLTAEGPVFLELAARSIGGHCSSALVIISGGREMSLEELILRHACRMPVETPRLAPGGAGVLMLPVLSAGVMGSVAGLPQAAALPGVTAAEIAVPRGVRLEPLPEGGRYLGFVVARGPDAAAVETTLREAWSLVRVEVDPDPGGTATADANW